MTTQAFGSAHLIEGKAELVALPEPAAATAHAPKPKNRLMLEVDSAVGPRERIPNRLSCHHRLKDGDPPPLKWSDLRYVFDIQEDCNGKEAIQA